MRVSPIVENFRLYSAEILDNRCCGQVLLGAAPARASARKAGGRMALRPGTLRSAGPVIGRAPRSRTYLERQESKHVSVMET
jgi:hypothetical protein